MDGDLEDEAETFEALLRDGDIDRAIELLERSRLYPIYWPAVTRAAVTSRPLWALPRCYAIVESLIGLRRAWAYDEAADWLIAAGQAYGELGHLAEFFATLDALSDRHAKNRSLAIRLARVEEWVRRNIVVSQMGKRSADASSSRPRCATDEDGLASDVSGDRDAR